MNIAVFCASADHIDQVYRDDARKLGEEIARGSCHLFYGGTNCGLMKIVADAAISMQGEVTGIIPECIRARGVAAEYTGQLIVAPDMKERKELLREYADAFIALPGGWGTLEEITEVITLKQLGQHNKPVVFLNTAGFYNRFFDFIRTIGQEGFVSGAYDHLYYIAAHVEEVLPYIYDYKSDIRKTKYE